MVERRGDSAFRISGELFARLEPMLPKCRGSKKGGGPRTSWRSILAGGFYVLRSGGRGTFLQPEFGSGRSVHSHF